MATSMLQHPPRYSLPQFLSVVLINRGTSEPPHGSQAAGVIDRGLSVAAGGGLQGPGLLGPLLSKPQALGGPWLQLRLATPEKSPSGPRAGGRFSQESLHRLPI